MAGTNRWCLFRLKNWMLFANMIANAIGVGVAVFLTPRIGLVSIVPEAYAAIKTVHMIFLPPSFAVPIMLVIWYERPIRRYLDQERIGNPISQERLPQVRRRLLNEPFALILIDLGIWLISGIVYPAALWFSGAPRDTLGQFFFTSLFTGLVTIAFAFFVLEHVLQRRLVPHFFPQGGLYKIPGTLRIRIGTRIGALIFAVNLVPFFALINIKEVRDEVLSGRTPLDGEIKDVTILFSDLRDFTPLTEQNDPKTVVKIMNAYFKEMAEAIREQGGLVLQFIGDEIYAVFGAPISCQDHPVRAFRAGLQNATAVECSQPSV
jgi:hypothetical protein